MDSAGLQPFLKENQLASAYALKAFQDFMLTRLGIKKGFFSAFELGAQSIEKLLKSYLFFKDKEKYVLNPKGLRSEIRKVAKSLGRSNLQPHDLNAISNIAFDNGLKLRPHQKENINLIDSYFFGRYPDDEKCKTLDCLAGGCIDSLIFDIWDNFKELNYDYYYTGGILTAVYAYYKVQKSKSNLKELIAEHYDIFINDNNAYRRREKELTIEIQQRLALVPCIFYGLT